MRPRLTWVTDNSGCGTAVWQTKTGTPGDARAKRLAVIVAGLTEFTPRPSDMAEAVYDAMIARMAMHQLVDEELRPRR